MIDLIVITGPTASGKTSLSFEIAKHFPIEIISADSRQVFKNLDIGTAKPNKHELKNIPHHFIDIINPNEYYSAGKFGEEAYKRVLEIKDKGKIPIVVGGSGLYIQALVEGLFDENISTEDKNTRKKLEADLKEKGIRFLREELKKVDIASYEKYEDGNPRRIIRALSYFIINSKPFSEAQILNSQVRKIKAHYFGIHQDREILYDRINKRALQMFDNGLIEETKRLLEVGYSPTLNSLDSVGYREVIKHLKGEMTKEEAISEVQKYTRRFAKRQLTWIRNQTPGLKWIGKNNSNVILKLLEKSFIQTIS